MRIVVAATALAVMAGGLVAGPATAEDCVEQTLTFGIVKAEGCFTQVGDRYDTTQKLRLNGFDVTPRKDVRVSVSKSSVTTNNGFVDMTAMHPTFGAIHFNFMNFAFAPPAKGSMTLLESAAAEPYIALLGLTPLGVKQPIMFNEGGTASFNLSFSLGGMLTSLVAKTDKEMAVTIGMEVEDGKFRIASGKFNVSEFELAELIRVKELSFEYEPPETLALDVEGGFMKPPVDIIGGLSITSDQRKINYAKLGLGGLNKPLGGTGIYFQKLVVGVSPFEPYGGSGTVGVTVGPKITFLGKQISAVEAEGTIAVRAEDKVKKKPGYFSTTGDFRLMNLPVANAAFTYWFGQGTQFSASVGIGLPSGRNDPGQPTYVGGGFSGWTTAKNFDLEGNAKFKLLGIDLVGAKTVISDYGMAACLQVGLWVGGGVRWSDGRGEMLGGFTCNIGDYQRQLRATQGAGDGKTRLSLDEGERIVRISAAEDGDTPQVVLTDGDREISSPQPGDSDGIQQDDDGVSFSTDDATVFVLDDPQGDWTIKTTPESAQMGVIETASPLPKHRTKAWITGKGRWRTLHWKARKIRYQKLSFSEVIPGAGEVPILRTGKASGTYRFKPSAGSYGVKRKLAVDVTQRFNTPRDSFTADTFRLKRLPAPKPVRGLQATRLMDTVVAQWKPVKGATKYQVEAIPQGVDAKFRTVVSKPNARLQVATTDMLQVRVRPINAQDRYGKARKIVIDTEDIVRNAGVAAGEAADRLQVIGAKRLATLVECPAGGQCEVTVQARRAGAVIGTTTHLIPPDMADRVVVRTKAPVKGATVRVRVDQEGDRGDAVRRIR